MVGVLQWPGGVVADAPSQLGWMGVVPQTQAVASDGAGTKHQALLCIPPHAPVWVRVIDARAVRIHSQEERRRTRLEERRERGEVARAQQSARAGVGGRIAGQERQRRGTESRLHGGTAARKVRGQGKGLQRPAVRGDQTAPPAHGRGQGAGLREDAPQAAVHHGPDSLLTDVLQEDDVRPLVSQQGQLLPGPRHATDIPACEAKAHGVSIGARLLSQKRWKGVGCETAHHQ